MSETVSMSEGGSAIGVPQTIAFGHDDTGNVTSIDYPYSGTVPDGRKILYTYDAIERVDVVGDITGGGAGFALAAYGYVGMGGHVSRADFRNEVQQSIVYDHRKRALGLSHIYRQGYANELTIDARASTWDDDNNRLTRDVSLIPGGASVTHTYEYDSI